MRRVATACPITRYVIVLMFVGGGLAGLAGMAEVSAIQGRLATEPVARLRLYRLSHQLDGGRPSARHHRGGAFVLAVITAGGDILQMTQALPGLGGEHPDGRACSSWSWAARRRAR